MALAEQVVAEQLGPRRARGVLALRQSPVLQDGCQLTAQLGAAGPTLGSQILLDSVAAIVIGGTALSGGVGGVGRTVLGVLMLTVLSNGLNQIGAADYTQTIIKGLVIIVAAVFTMASQRKLVVK